MPFDWMYSPAPPHIAEAGKARFRQMSVDEITQRAQLLRRLGHSRAYAELRCRRNLTWAFEGGAKPPLTDAEVKALVAEAYK